MPDRSPAERAGPAARNNPSRPTERSWERRRAGARDELDAQPHRAQDSEALVGYFAPPAPAIVTRQGRDPAGQGGLCGSEDRGRSATLGDQRRKAHRRDWLGGLRP